MIYLFSGNMLDTSRHVLERNGAIVPVEPQVFDLLHALAANAGAVMTKDDLVEAVWRGRIISDATISARISAARMAVGDNGRDQSIIRTVSRRGFRMVAEVTVADAAAGAQLDSSRGQVIRYAASQDGYSIAWSRAGIGPPILYAWHHLSHLELDWTSSLLSPTFAALSKDRSLIRYDIRGAGLSDPTRSDATIDDHVADLKAVADAAGLERFPIVAVLQAAAVAIRFAAVYPERISRLVLHNAYARGRAVRAGSQASQEGDPFIALLRSGGWGDPANGFMRAWATMVLPMASTEEVTELIRLIAHSGTAESALSHRMQIDHFDVSEDLSDVRAPTRVIHARMCPIHPVAEGRRVAAGIPSAEFMEVDSSNTFLIGSDPTFDRVIGGTLEFLSCED